MSDLLSLPRCFETPKGVKLGPATVVPDHGARAFVVRVGDARFHGFVVRKGEEAFGYVDRCPHAGLPLAQSLDAYLTPDADMIQCSWHGALFAIDTGECLGGPCVGRSLEPWPVTITDGMLVTR